MKYLYFLLSIICIELCASCSKSNDYLPIPKESEIVIRINTSGIAENVFMEKVKDFNFEDLFSWGEKDSTIKESFWKRLLADPGKAGVEYLSPVYLFQYKGERLAIVNLNNKDEFIDFIKGNNGRITTIENGFSNSTLADVNIAWNKNIATFIWSKNNNLLKEIVNLKKEETIFSWDYFQKHLSLSDDILCFLNPEKLLPEGSLAKRLKLLSSNSSLIKINFEKGSIQFSSDNLIHSESEKLFKQLKSENLSKIEDTSALVSLYFHLHPMFWNRLEDSTINSIGLKKSVLVSGISGEFYGKISKMNSGIHTFTTYEMDEDFNKVEISDTISYYYPSLYVLIPLTNSNDGQTILDNLTQKGYLSKIKGHYSYVLSSFPIILSIKENYIIASDTEKLELIQSSANKSLNVSNCFILRINPDQETNKIFNTETKLSGVDQINLSAVKESNGKVHVAGSILFKNKNKNGLFLLLEQIKNSNSIKPSL